MHKAQLLTDQMKDTTLEICKALKYRFVANSHRSILLSDEKLFTIEQAYNRQNDRMWSKKAPSAQESVISRSEKPKAVMVWAGICTLEKRRSFSSKMELRSTKGLSSN